MIQEFIIFVFLSYIVNETIGFLTLVAYRDAGTYGNVSLFFYAQNLEAQLGLDFNFTPSVSHNLNSKSHCISMIMIH